MDAMQEAPLFIERKQWFRILCVPVQTRLDRFTRVVRATPAEHTLDQHLTWRVDIDDGVHPLTTCAQELIERLRLWDGSREAIEDDPAQSRFRLAQREEMRAQHRDGHVIRHERTCRENLLDAPAERRLLRDVPAKEIAGRNVGKLQHRRDDGGLCSLAHALRTEEKDVR